MSRPKPGPPVGPRSASEIGRKGGLASAQARREKASQAGPPAGPSVICGVCSSWPCECKPTVRVLENVTEWHATVQVSVEVAVGAEGGILPVRAWFKGRELTANELGEIDIGRIRDALEQHKARGRR